MSRTEARILTSIWRNPEFKGLAMEGQWLYFLLLSQPRLSYCGVLPWSPRQLAKLAGNVDVSVVDQGARYLEFERFVLIDRDNEEVWIRTFVRHDGIVAQPNMIRAMAKDFMAIESDDIRDAFLEGLGEGFLQDLPQRFPRSFGEGRRESLAQGFIESFSKHFGEAFLGPFVEGPGEGEGEGDSSLVRTKGGSRNIAQGDRLAAEAVVNDWWESQDPRPPNSWTGVVEVVRRLLASGAKPDDVRRALDEAPMPTLGALQFSLNRPKTITSHGDRIITDRDSPTVGSIPQPR
jgi:hypothetical protein